MLIFLNLHIYGNIHRLFLKQIQVIYSDEHKKQKNNLPIKKYTYIIFWIYWKGRIHAYILVNYPQLP